MSLGDEQAVDAPAEPRWLVRRRAEAAAAMMREEATPKEQACSLYGLSVAQFEGCRRAAERRLAPRTSPRSGFFARLGTLQIH